MKNFRDLKVWTKAHELALSAYRATTSFPSEERFGLTSQIRRCSSSIPANIAESCGRGSDGDFQRFLQVAMGSATELEYHLLLGRDLNYLTQVMYSQLQNVVEVKRMLAALIVKVGSDSVPKVSLC